MRKNKTLAGLLPLSVAITLSSCAPGLAPSVQPGQQLAVTPVHSTQLVAQPEQAKTHHVTFHISFPRDFQLSDINVAAKYARLRVQGLVNGQLVTKLPTNGDADANGFVPVNGNNVNVGADIPEGNNWVLIADMHVNNNPASNPLSRVMGPFHVTASGSPAVDVNPRSYLAGMIVSALQEMKSSLLNTALNLTALKDFCDALTGASGTGDATTFARLNTTGLSKPNQLSGRALALALANGTAMTTAGGQGLTPASYRQTPYVDSAYNMVPGNPSNPSLSHSGLPAISADNGNLFFMDVLYGKQLGTVSSNYFYSVSPGLTEKYRLQKSEIYYGAHSLGHGTGGLPVIYANTSDSTQMLRSYKQSDASLVWSYTFGGGTGRNAFVPASQTDTKGTPSTSDDEDVVYSFYPAPAVDTKGIYAVQGGVPRWFYNTVDLTNAGALSPDGNTFYAMTWDDAAAKLIALPTRVAGTFVDKINGGCLCNLKTNQNTPSWTVNLSRGALQTTSPSIGSDGTIYVGTYNSTTSGYLEAYNPNGTKKWEIALPPSASPSSIQRPGAIYPPLIDRQNGRDVIYVFTGYAQVFAINDDGTPKWTNANNQIQAVQLGSTPDEPTINKFKVHTSGAPVLGVEPLSLSRVMYTGICTDTNGYPQVAAIRDDGSSGTVVWSKFLGATFSNGGFQLKDGYLYYMSIDGGEGTVTALQRVKVEADNLPSGAPWPIFGGNPALSGRRPSDVNL